MALVVTYPEVLVVGQNRGGKWFKTKNTISRECGLCCKSGEGIFISTTLDRHLDMHKSWKDHNLRWEIKNSYRAIYFPFLLSFQG